MSFPFSVSSNKYMYILNKYEPKAESNDYIKNILKCYVACLVVVF